jgi:hypothetical protein
MLFGSVVMSCMLIVTVRCCGGNWQTEVKSTNCWSEWFRGRSDNIGDACCLSVVTCVEIILSGTTKE